MPINLRAGCGARRVDLWRLCGGEIRKSRKPVDLALTGEDRAVGISTCLTKDASLIEKLGRQSYLAFVKSFYGRASEKYTELLPCKEEKNCNSCFFKAVNLLRFIAFIFIFPNSHTGNFLSHPQSKTAPGKALGRGRIIALDVDWD